VNLAKRLGKQERQTKQHFMRLIFSCYGQSKSQQGLEPVHILSLTQTDIPGKSTPRYHTVKNENNQEKYG